MKKFFKQEQDCYKPVTIYDSNGDRNENLSINEYLGNIKPYLKNIIIDLHKCDTWKIQLTAAISFMSSKDTNEECTMYSKSDNIEVMT